jgi:catechol 2,3-dioxygenase-like lactoylglutathione lyase family enzyme
MADLQVGGLHRTSSITKDVGNNAEFDAGVLGMRLIYRSVNFDDSATYHLALANGASSRGREEGPTQEELAPVRHLGRRVAEKGALLVGGRAHV